MLQCAFKFFVRAQSLGNPLFLAPLGVRVPALSDVDAEKVLEPGARNHQLGSAVMQTPIGLVAHDKTVFAIVDHETVGNTVNRILQ